jgi:hypothetical protein
MRYALAIQHPNSVACSANFARLFSIIRPQFGHSSVIHGTIVALKTLWQHREDILARLSEAELKRLIKGGETTTVELKLAAPRPVEMAQWLRGMVNAHCGVVIIGQKDANHEIVGVQENHLGETLDVIFSTA